MKIKSIILVLWRFFLKLLPPYKNSISKNLKKFQKKNIGKIIIDRLDNSDVSVVIPCYNHAKYLKSTFSCIINQTYRPFEVIFVEDHSTDDSFAEIERLCQLLPSGINHKILRTPRNSGQCYAINLGVESTTSSIIMVLNDDDYLMHDAIEASVEILRSQEDIYLLGSTSTWFSGLGDPDFSGAPLIKNILEYKKVPLKKYYPDDVIMVSSANDINLTQSGSVFLRNAWKSVGGFYKNKKNRVIKYSDRDFQLRVASLYPIAVSCEIPFVFWRSDSSVDGKLLS